MALNSLSDLEYVYLVTSIEAVFAEHWDCNKCLRRYTGENLQKQLELKGCKGLNDFRYQIENIKYSKCPGNYTLPQVSYLMSVFNQYEQHGKLPTAQNLLDELYKNYEILTIIEARVRILREAQVKKTSKKRTKKR